MKNRKVHLRCCAGGLGRPRCGGTSKDSPARLQNTKEPHACVQTTDIYMFLKGSRAHATPCPVSRVLPPGQLIGVKSQPSERESTA